MGGMAAKNGFGRGGHTVCAVLSPKVVPGTYEEKTYACSVLRTPEDRFRLPTYLGSAIDVARLPVAWE